MAASASLVASISSASASTDGSPIMSMSHWWNCRYRPRCGRSARHTGPTCNDRNGIGSDAWLFP